MDRDAYDLPADEVAAMRDAVASALRTADRTGRVRILAPRTYMVRPGHRDLPDTAWIVDPAEPFAVTLRLRKAADRRRRLNWRISRDLVAEGLESPAGIGDVRLERITDDELPCGDWLRVELCTPDGQAMLLTDAWTARVAVAVSYRQHPPGTDLDIDDVDLAVWLGSWAG